MNWIQSLQRAIDYIEEHLLDSITIEEIANQANASAFHFQRTFSLLTDCSVGEYIRRRRLSQAAHELCNSNIKIIDLAFKYGYDTPESFTKAFRRQHGISPSEARKNMGSLKSYHRLAIQVILKGAEPMKYRIVEKDAFNIIGIKQEFSIANNENLIGIPKMWDEVNGNGIDEKLFSLNNGAIKGALGVCVEKEAQAGCPVIDYWIATAYEGDVPKEFKSLEIPASKWVVFEVHGPMPDAMQKTWKQIYSEWFPASGYKHSSGVPELEVYTDEDPTSPDLYSEIWIPIQ